MIIAESAYARADLGAAERAYRAAYEAARVDEDGIEALRGWTLTSLQGEMPGSEDLMTELQRNAPASAQDLVRHAILELIQLRFTSGFARADALLDEAEALLPQVEDPRPRSSFAYVAAYVSSLRARYDKAARWQELSDHDIDAFDLDFARPHSYWNHAHVALGQRKFGHAERLLQKLEDETKENPLDYHVLNARVLRARLCLSTGDAADALRRLPPTTREKVLPSILGEYHATRALALAATGRRNDALAAAERAEDETSAVEVKILSAGVRAITATRTQVRRQALALWEAAQALDVWDPVVAAVRISEPLAAALSQFESEREILGALYRRSGDHGLARRSGLRTRASGSAAELLSPRELEVLGLLARGYRNRDIAEALVVSLSTVKVHVRHIFEKLGVRTRAEAVTRLSLD
jgi:DNA-binding NarL/FixJ family response regulator